MKIRKLTKQSELKLYKDIKSPDLKTVKRYTTKGEQWEMRGKDNLELYLDGSYQIDDKYFDRFGQYKFDASTCQKDDFEHAKIIYTQLSDLTAADANDSRFWTRLTHQYFHNYVRERWYTKTANNTNKDTINKILDRSHFFGKAQRARVHNAISRLWWVAHLTVRFNEENEQKKWELTKAAFKYQENTSSLLERNMAAYECIRIGYLEFFIEHENDIESKDVKKILKVLNNYGGGNILSLLTKPEVKEILLKIKQDL